MPAPPVRAAEAVCTRRLRRRWAVIGGALLVLAAALYVVLGPKPPPPPHPRGVTPQEAATASAHIDAVRQALTQDAPTPATSTPKTPPAAHARTLIPPETQTLRVSQEDLNTYLAGNTRLKASLEAKGVHAVTVELHAPDDITLHAAATFRGISGSALIAATLVPDQRTAIHLDITQARFGRFPPPIVRAAAAAILDRVLTRPGGALPVTIQGVRVVGTDVLITETRPESPAHP